MQIKCPKCKTMIEYSVDNPYRPFCSARCQMVDLGQWANEEYAIPSTKPLSDDDLEKAMNADKPSNDDENRGQGDLQ